MDRLLFLDNSIPDDLYHPLSYWQPLLLLPFDVCRVCAGELPAHPDEYSHIFISGSTASVLENSDWMQAEMELIREAVARGSVILGSCFGHQIIARALFGHQAVRRRSAPEIGWPDIEIMTKEFSNTKKRLNELLVLHTGQPLEKIEKDTDRNYFMSANEAKNYGLIDKVYEFKIPPADKGKQDK